MANEYKPVVTALVLREKAQQCRHETVDLLMDRILNFANDQAAKGQNNVRIFFPRGAGSVANDNYDVRYTHSWDLSNETMKLLGALMSQHGLKYVLNETYTRTLEQNQAIHTQTGYILHVSWAKEKRCSIM